MEKQYIKYKDKEYQIKEPTIEQWSRLSALKEWSDDIEFTTILMAEMTGLSKEEIEEANWQEVLMASQIISKTILEDGKRFHNEFEYEKQKYRFVDLPNLTFGEFIDVDSYLSKTEEERLRDLNLLMAFLYREVDDEGNLVKYDSSKIGERAEKFKKLPVKYVNGATTFFLRLGKISPDNLIPSLENTSPLMLRMKVIWILVRLIVSVSIGVGLAHWLHYRTKILQRLAKLLHIR
jgi:hypothetical protein